MNPEDKQYRMGRDLMFLGVGFLLGSAFSVALNVKAECCAQFDVPFNLQLEQERQSTWERSLDTDYLDNIKPYDPCVR
jgi:hypothetical protein